ncbi:hypothetical protein [Paraconexibacter algicola]|uniref:hypothetical protein n=1 Tax=Paraconexibacter algicola TaxID=2133960 RepID=UPI001304A891|nr:hypothetical protein [Paraconexibacter algicola]
MTAENLDRVLTWLMGLDRPLQMGLTPEARVDELGLTEPEVDDLLREAVSLGLLRADRADYGHTVRWVRLELTPAGLRHCGQWPPQGREHHAGPWDDGDWGRTCVPILRRVQSSGFRGDLLPGLYVGASPEQWRQTLAAHALREAGYLDGSDQDNRAISALRVSALGREALDPRPRDPLDEAILLLRSSATSAVVQAVEVALGNRLRALDEHHSESRAERSAPRLLSTLNDELTGKNGPQLYGKHWKKTIEAVLAVRNEYAHGRGDALPDDVAVWVISTVRLLLAELPLPDPG